MTILLDNSLVISQNILALIACVTSDEFINLINPDLLHLEKGGNRVIGRSHQITYI